MNVYTGAFNSVQIWVQIWNVPLKWMSKEVGAKIGKLFSKVSEVLIPETGSSRGRCIKILATVYLEKPLLRGANIKLDSEVCWVDFKYEQIAAFCFYCGRVGHSERVCASRGEDLHLNKLKNGQYGEWLKGVGRSSEGKTGGGRLIHNMVHSREEQNDGGRGEEGDSVRGIARAAGEKGRLEEQQSEKGVREGASFGVGDQANQEKVQQLGQNTGGDRVEEVRRGEGLRKLGECSKLMEIEWKHRETEKGAYCNQVELINIPVQGGSREPLANITNFEIQQGAVAKAKGSRK